MKKISILSPLLAVVFLFLTFFSAAAQTEPELSLRLSRIMGYSSGGGKMQGTFSMRASGPENLARVVFFIDGQQIGEDVDAPYGLQFSTSAYSLGTHQMSATGYTTDGRELQSNVVQGSFVTAQEGWQAAMRILIPLLVLVAGAAFISSLATFLSARKPSSLPLGAPRSYGVSGGAICPKCERPSSMNFFGLNLLTGKLDRCPYCGKWSIVRRASPQQLRAAEAAELSQASGQIKGLSEEEKLRKELEQSRFQDL